MERRFRVEFANITVITERYKDKIEKMKENFLIINEKYTVGIEGKESWSFTPAPKFTHVCILLTNISLLLWEVKIKTICCSGHVLHLPVLPPGVPVWEVPGDGRGHRVQIQHQPPLLRVWQVWRGQAVRLRQGHVSLVQNPPLQLQVYIILDNIDYRCRFPKGKV